MNWYGLFKSSQSVSISIERWQQSMQKKLESLIDFTASEDSNLEDKYTEDMAQRDLQRMSAETQQNMQIILNQVQEAISRTSNWNNSPVVVRARTHDNDNPIDAGDDAEISVGAQSAWGGIASFTYFVWEGKTEIDDILEAGDTDFFEDQNIQSDYFNLVTELKYPGSSSREGKTLNLYTARPVKDRQVYENATSIPSNIFLTNNPNRALGIASDLSSQGSRDVWRIQIDENKLIQTLDSPEAKDYQAVGGEGGIPIKSIILYHEGSG
tara:strand:- start:15614 stop:16417 length:804 start_codon:yes stop_codon:yes gene_type:complete